MQVLIAEDDDISRMLLQTAVELFGHTCLVAEDGAQAWEIFQNSTVDVVISDRGMPGMDGIELCRRIRQTPRRGYTYFMFLTALDEQQQLLVGIGVGADDYLTKPLNYDDLHVRLLVAARVTALHQQLAKQQDELERLNAQLFAQARCDPLTQLGNRLRLREDLEVLAGQVVRYSHRYCAVLCDVDHFKGYNDHYGHLAGDTVLRTVADTIGRSTRAGDLVYRYGGEEFLLILPEQSLWSAVSAAERTRQAVEQLGLAHAGKTPVGAVTISAGVAMLEPNSGVTIHDWLRNADTALYRAKAAGRNRVVPFEDVCEPPETSQE
jgi:two-component system, cell cycle response regulator